MKARLRDREWPVGLEVAALLLVASVLPLAVVALIWGGADGRVGDEEGLSRPPRDVMKEAGG